MLKKVIFLMILTLIPITAPCDEFGGPFTTTVNYPPQMMFLSFSPDTVNTVKKGKTKYSLNFGYSNIFQHQENSKNSIICDLEMMNVTGIFTYGLSENIQWDIHLPILFVGGGFLDEPIDFFHKMINLPRGERKHTSRNKVHYKLKTKGKTIFDIHNSYLSPGNISSFIKWKIGKKWALKGGIKIPTAPKSKGFSSKKVDVGLDVIFEQKLLSSLKMYTDLNYMYLGKPSFVHTKHYRYGGSFGMNALWTKNTHIIAQYTFLQSPFKTELHKLDKVSHQITGGIRYKKEGKCIGIFITEDLTPYSTTPDITISTTFTF
jgi:hypothetical protein